MFSSSKPALTLALALILGSACIQAEPTVTETTTKAALETETTNTCSAEVPLACGTTCVDPDSNPNNCGGCGNVCASGLCYAGVCADDRAGNIFVIGHAYNTSNPALDRL